MSSVEAFTELDAAARTLRAGELRAVFLPNLGMLGASLQHRGEELLGRVQELASFAQSGRTCGIPLLYPWANRLAETRYIVAGKTVSLEAASRIGHDDKGLPMHGIPWSRLAWRVTGQDGSNLQAELDWTRPELLDVFPFPHHVEMNIALLSDSLTIETILRANESGAVPVSFGFHPYVKIPNAPRSTWQVQLPAMSQLRLDAKNIPTGDETPFPAFDAKLGAHGFDDGFKLLDSHARFSIMGNGRRVTVEFVKGYSHAQIFAPPAHDYIAFEPMTAPTNALVSGRGLRIVSPGEIFRATFRIAIAS